MQFLNRRRSVFTVVGSLIFLFNPLSFAHLTYAQTPSPATNTEILEENNRENSSEIDSPDNAGYSEEADLMGEAYPQDYYRSISIYGEHYKDGKRIIGLEMVNKAIHNEADFHYEDHWALQFTDGTMATLDISPAGLSFIDELLVSPDGQYLAILSEAEGAFNLDIIDLNVLLDEGRDLHLLSYNPYPGVLRIEGWQDDTIIISSSALLNLPPDQRLGLFFDQEQQFSLNLKSGEIIALSENAQNLDQYFLAKLLGEERQGKFDAISYFQGVTAMEFLPQLQYQLTVEKDEEIKESLKAAIEQIGGVERR